jgi:hypothetical protein
VNKDDAQRRIERAIAQRHDEFALSEIQSTPDGYTLKFRQSIVVIVRTRIGNAVLADDNRLESFLNEVRRDLQRLTGNTPHASP